MGFQTQVNIQLAFGIPGALYDDSPVRATPWELNSSQAGYNIIGSTAFTAISADPGDSSGSGVAKAGGTGVFVGILANSKVYATSGTSTGALTPTLSLPNFTIGELITMGHLIVALPGPASIGDQVCFDATTGAISTYPSNATFTASIATTGVMTVASIQTGMIQPGMILSGTGVGGVTVTAFDSGSGGTGTYYTDYNGAAGAISSEAMTGRSLPPSAATFTAAIATTGIMTVSAVGSGQLGVGQTLTGTGVPANTVITAFGSGEGNTGTYTVSPAPASAVTSTTITTDAQIQIARAEVIRFQPAGNGGLGVISLTGA